MTLFHASGKPNGITLLIVPGGAYVRVVIDKEGFESAEWFAQRGFDCAVLRYRMPADGWAAGPDAPVHDAMRALRLLRSRAGRNARGRPTLRSHRILRRGTPDRAPDHRTCTRLSTSGRSRCAFSPPGFRGAHVSGDRNERHIRLHSGSARQLLAAGVAADELDRYSPNLHVGAHTPPTLLVHAADDGSVPVENSLLMFAALRAAGVRSELHVFDRGGHGFGMRGVAGIDASAWPQLVENWALSNAKP